MLYPTLIFVGCNLWIGFAPKLEKIASFLLHICPSVSPHVVTQGPVKILLKI
jgi:hypothetical protein